MLRSHRRQRSLSRGIGSGTNIHGIDIAIVAAVVVVVIIVVIVVIVVVGGMNKVAIFGHVHDITVVIAVVAPPFPIIIFRPIHPIRGRGGAPVSFAGQRRFSASH